MRYEFVVNSWKFDLIMPEAVLWSRPNLDRLRIQNLFKLKFEWKYNFKNKEITSLFFNKFFVIFCCIAGVETVRVPGEEWTGCDGICILLIEYRYLSTGTGTYFNKFTLISIK